MERTRTRYLALVGGFVLGVVSAQIGCRAINPHSPFHGSMSCSCSGTGCGCSHCTGADARCQCRGTDAYGDMNAVGEPGEPR